MLLFFLSASCALIVSFLCSLMEAALLSLSPSQLAQLNFKYPRVGNIWGEFKQHLDKPLAVILFSNTAAHTIGATIAGAQCDSLWGGSATFIFSLVFTYTMLQFTEILPKSLGVRYNLYVALYMTYPIRFLIKIMSPIIWFIHFVNRPFKPKIEHAEQSDALDEIAALAGQACDAGELTENQGSIIQATAHLDDDPLSEIMIPVEQISFFSDDMTLDEALNKAHLDPHTRFPVIEGNNCNRILGYINFKELIYHMHTNPADPSLQGIIRPVYLAEPSQSVNDLLKIFVDRHEHIAIVRDDEGETLGLITMEDLVEQLLGKDLWDEFDRPPTMLHSLSGGTWMVGGGIPVARLSKRLQFNLPCHEPEKTILSDFLIEQFGKQPQTNDIIKIGSYNFMIRRIRRGKIFETSVSQA